MKRNNRKNKPEPFRKNEFNLLELLADNKKIVMPVALLAALGITFAIAVSAGKKDDAVGIVSSVEGVEVSSNEISDEAGSGVSVAAGDIEMEENAHADVTDLINRFYTAQAAGDLDTIEDVTDGMTEAARVRFREAAEYIESFNNIKVYTKNGPEANSYITYVCYDEKFTGHDAQIPGLTTYYIRSSEEGKLSIYFGELDTATNDYIAELNLQDDYVDLSNEVSVNFNSMLAESPELEAFLTDLSEKLTEAVGKELAMAATDEENGASKEAPEGEGEILEDDSAVEGENDSTDTATEGGEDGAEAEAEPENNQPAVAKVILVANDVVNVRSSDSINADKVGKTEKGKKYTCIEELGNGWSKIEFSGASGGVGYVKTEFFDKASEAVEDSNKSDNAEDNKPAENNNTSSNSSNSDNKSSGVDSNGTYHVRETVRIRESASTESDIVTNAYQGDEIEVTNYRADGWCEVEYKGKKGFVKTEFLEK
ncbi:SH3 domain-containing protein [Butyrivibrio sp. MC2013]|uniref:SH3 domain-containing protein n=1 Tax=Butyrivibrio sp. MC2013 TaxID=1280686 RepID=UPI00041724EF|nr:SH3 domain-containing protein [Butyrivibrio sp. MC2013]